MSTPPRRSARAPHTPARLLSPPEAPTAAGRVKKKNNKGAAAENAEPTADGAAELKKKKKKKAEVASTDGVEGGVTADAWRRIRTANKSEEEMVWEASLVSATALTSALSSNGPTIGIPPPA